MRMCFGDDEKDKMRDFLQNLTNSLGEDFFVSMTVNQSMDTDAVTIGGQVSDLIYRGGTIDLTVRFGRPAEVDSVEASPAEESPTLDMRRLRVFVATEHPWGNRFFEVECDKVYVPGEHSCGFVAQRSGAIVCFVKASDFLGYEVVDTSKE